MVKAKLFWSSESRGGPRHSANLNTIKILTDVMC